MNELKEKNTITSMELLEQINLFREQEGNRAKLQHYDLLKVIRDEFEEEIDAGKISAVEYKDKKGEKRPEKTIHKKEMEAIKKLLEYGEVSTEKTQLFYMNYNKFVRKAVIHYIEELENKLKQIGMKNNKPTDETKLKRLEIMEKNANVRISKQFLKLAELTKNDRHKDVLIALSTNSMTNEETLPLPRLEQKSYTAEEIGSILGISANMVGRIENKHDLKNDRYGYLAQDKAKHCDKSVESFRYFEHAIDEFKKYIQ